MIGDKSLRADKEMSVSINAKSLLYRENGTGRDTYISVDNGGMYRSTTPVQEYPVSSFMGRYRPRSVGCSFARRVNRYNSNGSGRDSYIQSDSGGFEPGVRAGRFEGTLRSYHMMFRTAEYYVTLKDRLRMKKRSAEQVRLTARLSRVNHIRN